MKSDYFYIDVYRTAMESRRLTWTAGHLIDSHMTIFDGEYADALDEDLRSHFEHAADHLERAAKRLTDIYLLLHLTARRRSNSAD